MQSLHPVFLWYTYGTSSEISHKMNAHNTECLYYAKWHLGIINKGLVTVPAVIRDRFENSQAIRCINWSGAEQTSGSHDDILLLWVRAPEGNRNVQFIDPNQYAILLILDMNRTSEMDIFMKLVARSICNLVNIADKVNNVLVKSVNMLTNVISKLLSKTHFFWKWCLEWVHHPVGVKMLYCRCFAKVMKIH